MNSEAYWEGYHAYLDNAARDENPYDPWLHEDYWNKWNQGFGDAAWDD